MLPQTQIIIGVRGLSLLWGVLIKRSPLSTAPPSHITCSPRYLYLPLVCAERAWAMAMELKQEVNSDPRKRFHLLRRLKKATKHADQLLMLSETCERCDARTRLEAQVIITNMLLIYFL